MSKANSDPNNPHIRTFTDKRFYFLSFKPEDICIEDIAHALSNICRYTGHCKQFYSVAEHSIKCCDKGSNWLCQIWGLLHDAAEAYISDISSPLKGRLHIIDGRLGFVHQRIGEYEKSIIEVIATKFNLFLPIPEEVHNADRELLYEEMETLWSDGSIATMTPKDAEQMFLSYFKTLELKRING